MVPAHVVKAEDLVRSNKMILIVLSARQYHDHFYCEQLLGIFFFELKSRVILVVSNVMFSGDLSTYPSFSDQVEYERCGKK